MSARATLAAATVAGTSVSAAAWAFPRESSKAIRPNIPRKSTRKYFQLKRGGQLDFLARSEPVACASRGSVSIDGLSFGVGRARERQLNFEAAAHALGALEIHLPAMRGANGFDDGKPQAGTAHFARPGLVHPEEALKDVRSGLLRNAHPVVLHLQHRLAARGHHRQFHFPAGRGVFDGVVKQVHDDLFHARTVSLNR